MGGEKTTTTPNRGKQHVLCNLFHSGRRASSSEQKETHKERTTTVRRRTVCSAHQTRKDKDNPLHHLPLPFDVLTLHSLPSLFKSSDSLNSTHVLFLLFFTGAW
eukprot:Hpha_TRINITY_DN15283_c1_g1::TRINITY_DN15283_c1_g1_i1::g.68164::m.68164